MDLTDNLKGGLAAISGSAATTRLVIEKVPTNIDNGTPIAETVFKDGRVPITDPPIIYKVEKEWDIFSQSPLSQTPLSQNPSTATHSISTPETKKSTHQVLSKKAEKSIQDLKGTKFSPMMAMLRTQPEALILTLIANQKQCLILSPLPGKER